MTQNTTIAAGCARPRSRRRLAMLVGVSVMLTPLATTSAAQAQYGYGQRAHSSSSKLFQQLLGGGNGRGYGSIDGVGSLVSRVTDVASDIGDDSPGPGFRKRSGPPLANGLPAVRNGCSRADRPHASSPIRSSAS